VAAPNPAMKDRLLTSTEVLRLNPFDPVYNPAGRSAGWSRKKRAGRDLRDRDIRHRSNEVAVDPG